MSPSGRSPACTPPFPCTPKSTFLGQFLLVPPKPLPPLFSFKWKVLEWLIKFTTSCDLFYKGKKKGCFD